MPDKKTDDEDLSSWLLPFTDMVVVLMAFFAVLYTTSLGIELQTEKQQQTVTKTSKAESTHKIDNHIELDLLADDIEKMLADHKRFSQVYLTRSQDNFILIAPSKLLFSSASDHLTHEAKSFIHKIANISIDRPVQIQIEGHTDSHPINSARFASNWELSTARATQVVRQFIHAGVDAKRLSAVGYADTRSRIYAENNASLQRRVVLRFYQQ